ncbi:MAG TPA: hypothetical protein VGJ22_14610 [Anaerolineales bacterium]|jgi:uncharacterized membrane protein
MDIFVIVLRLVHVICGVIWVGASVTLAFFIGPTIGATQDAGQQFMRHFILRTRFSALIATTAILTVLAGFALYYHDSNGFTSAWENSGPGIGFAIGAAFALIGLVCGILVGITSGALARLSASIQGKPAPDQLAKLQALAKRQGTIGSVNVVALLLATIMMAIARYLVF